MAATHVVSLFLPHTIDFHDSPELASPSSRPRPEPPRASSMTDLPSRPSQSSLLNGLTPPQTPNTAAEEFFSAIPRPPLSEGSDARKRLFAKPGDPRSLVRSDGDAPEWGRHRVYNQPRSRARPLPSNSILDFAKVLEDFQQRERKEAEGNKTARSPSSRSSRCQSNERAYQSWVVQPADKGNGGLTNAMRAAAASKETEIHWIGTLGFPTDALPQDTKEHLVDHLLNEYQSEVVYVRDTDLHGHYAHYCKTILWPIFHYQVPDGPKSKAYADHSWEFYRNLNQVFADKVVDSYKRNDTIWIHDYHLLLVPGMVRAKLPDAQIGFFLHTAFPSSEIFRCLSTRKFLLEGMLGANLVAFQNEEYAGHFLQTCSRLLTVETTKDGVLIDDRFVNVTSQAIGINPPAIQEARQDEEVAAWTRSVLDKFKSKRLIVACDKLDSVHGVRQKLLAYELFLNKYTEWREKTVLIQVATSTNEQSELITTATSICTRIDNAHSTLMHQPLVFLKQDIDFSQYLALLTVADVLMISALRDGMNLMAHEFVFCQDGAASRKKHGPLILSEFTGSAAVFGNDAISINPWDYHQQANAINTALVMIEAEKERRWRDMYNVVLKQTGGRWADELDKTLVKVYQEQHDRAATSIPRLSVVQLSEKYRQGRRRVFIIDYEGTLAPHKTSTGMPLTSPHRIIDTLTDLLYDAKNVVYVMSGRKSEELENIFRTAEGLGLIAENGCYVREHGKKPGDWHSFVDLEKTTAWKTEVKSILKYYQERMEGSYLKERRCSLMFRYGDVKDQGMAKRLAGDCAEQINSSCKAMRIHVVPVHQALLVEQLDFSKGTAATNIFGRLRENIHADDLQQPDFLMVAGDDREDEVAFRWANDLGTKGIVRDVFTISVGRRNTEAQAALAQGSTGLLSVLQKLAAISLDSMPMDYFGRARARS